MTRISNLLAASSWRKKFVMLCTSLFMALLSFAQDKKIDVDINTGKDSGGSFFNSPVVWVVGAAVFILLLVALMRNNRSRRTDV